MTNDGNETQHVVRNLIGRILHNHGQQKLKEIFPVYERFVKLLKPGERIMSFNYDTLLESLLEEFEIPYRLVPNRFEEIHEMGGTLSREVEREIILLKMHGSIDWFDDQEYQKHANHRRKSGLPPNKTSHVIFLNKEIYFPEKIVGEPYHLSSDLNRIYRAKNLETFFEKTPSPLISPLILTPSNFKILYSQPLRDFWYGLAKSGIFESLVIIGYSMPKHDEHIRQVLYKISDTYHRFIPSDWMTTKTDLRIVDFRKTWHSKRDLKRNYRFLHWEGVKTYLKGLDKQAVEFIFSP